MNLLKPECSVNSSQDTNRVATSVADILATREAEKERLLVNLFRENGLSRELWIEKHGEKFEKLWKDGLFGFDTDNRTSLQLEVGIFLLYR